MKLVKIQECLDGISETSRRSVKEEILKGMYEEYGDVAASVLRYAYDPYKTYGLSGETITLNDFDERPKKPLNDDQIKGFFTFLDKLETRQLTGNAARSQYESLSALLHNQESKLLYNIINKDLRCGISISTINKALGKGFIEKFDVMLAHPYDPDRINSWPVATEIKMDGMRCVAKVTDGKSVEFLSRGGKDITSIPHLEEQILTMLGDEANDMVVYVDGELTSGNFNMSMSALRKKDQVAKEAVFHVFEILTENEFKGKSPTTYLQRVTRLTKNFSEQPSIKFMKRTAAQSHEEVIKLFRDAHNDGNEGIIVKPLNGVYKPKRSYDWMKVKDCKDVDLPITGVYEGKGKYKGALGGIIVNFEGVSVEVGSGFSDQQRQDFWKDQKELIGVTAELQYHEVTPAGSLREPRFIRLRDDK